jgi:hypothetical protein
MIIDGIYPLYARAGAGLGGTMQGAMIMNFKYHQSLGLLDFDAKISPYDPQHFKAQLESETGRRIFEVVTSRDGKLVAALATRRRDPVVPDLEPFIAAAGSEAFEDRYKQYTGHLVKHVVQCMGGEIERKGVDVTIPDTNYTRATRYRSPYDVITINRHSNGSFTVAKNLSLNGSPLFETWEKANAHAQQLQAQAGGQDKARIVERDFKGEAERSAALLASWRSGQGQDR